MTLASLDGFNAPETIWDNANLVLYLDDCLASHGDYVSLLARTNLYVKLTRCWGVAKLTTEWESLASSA
jgi:uncharacterized protein YcgI (DUF1989 family)